MRDRKARALFLALAGLALALTPALATAPIPRAKPPLPSEISASPDPALVPLPRAKPDKPIVSAAPLRAWPKGTGAWPRADVLTARAACERMLQGLDIIWRPDQPIGEPGGCGTPAPIAIAEVAQIRIDPPATVGCDFAKALHGWLSQSVQPLAKKQVGANVIGIRNASSYACRRRNNASSGKLSEHAKANALDIAAFDFSRKAQITVAGGTGGLLQKIGLSGKGNFMKAVRKSACQYFNTVLGPGADRHHGDHFHVDLMKLRPGRFKMCR
ncbi:extensin-like domain-containing protein [Taklimakanibacter deserti]|uniref:extensin-like domain-containing protein n=1 Tax=Taklimakanibacter deserti TaxID=2267839 RepID=UPI0013C463F7